MPCKPGYMQEAFWGEKKAKKLDFNSFYANVIVIVQQYFHHIQAQLLYFIFNTKCKIIVKKNLHYLTGSM